MSDYRKKYSKFLEVNLRDTVHVHHIDLDRNNNSIHNLVALPNNVHSSYHALRNKILEQYTDTIKTLDIFFCETKFDVDLKQFNGIKMEIFYFEMAKYKRLEILGYHVEYGEHRYLSESFFNDLENMLYQDNKE